MIGLTDWLLVIAVAVLIGVVGWCVSWIQSLRRRLDYLDKLVHKAIELAQAVDDELDILLDRRRGEKEGYA